MSLRDLQKTIREAVKYFSQYGYTSEKALDLWVERITKAAQGALVSPEEASAQIARHLGAVYSRAMRRLPKRLAQLQTSVAERMRPEMFYRRLESFPQLAHKMRVEVDRRIAASADLIKIRREEAMAATLRRFRGWASSVPATGTPAPPKNEVDLLTKEFRKVRFETNRLNVDQGHKLNAALNMTMAEGTGAVAMIWHSNWRQEGYQYREAHKARDEKVYTIRDNWAQEKGLMKVGEAGYTDEITQPAEEIFCRCWYQPVHQLDRLPDDMLTDKGRAALKALDEAAAA